LSDYETPLGDWLKNLALTEFGKSKVRRGLIA